MKYPVIPSHSYMHGSPHTAFTLQTTTICIELKREGDKKSPKRIGSVEIDLKPSSPGRATLEEQWYTVKVDRPDKTCPALRIKHRSDLL